MKISHAMIAGAVSLMANGAAVAQGGHMMDEGMRGFAWAGGYSGVLLPVFVVFAAAGLVTWFVGERGK